MTTATASGRSSGCCRGYSHEQKTLRAKLDHLLKWTRDLKSNILKQSSKALQTINSSSSDVNRQIIDQIHDDLDEYKRKFDRELGRIHDICDALTHNSARNGDEENLRDEILQALRRSPTYSSLEQHMDDDARPRIRVKPRENHHPGQSRTPRISSLSTDKIKRKASQPIAFDILDTTRMPGAKRRPQISAFKRSRSFTNIEHTETQLGMDYVEEDQSDLSWKPFGPKRPPPQVSHLSDDHEQPENDPPAESSIRTSQSLPTMPIEKQASSSCAANDSSDEEFDIAWQRRAKQKARQEAAAGATPLVESPSKRTVRFSPSTHEPVEFIELDLDQNAQDVAQQTRDQNNNNNKQHTEVVNLDDDDEEISLPVMNGQSQIRTTCTTTPVSSQQAIDPNDGSLTIDDSDDDEIIALSDEDAPKPSTIIRRKTAWTASEIQVSSGKAQSQSLHNPYRVGIADPSLRSVFLPPPSSQMMAAVSGGNRRRPVNNRKTPSNKRTASSK